MGSLATTLVLVLVLLQDYRCTARHFRRRSTESIKLNQKKTPNAIFVPSCETSSCCEVEVDGLATTFCSNNGVLANISSSLGSLSKSLPSN